MADWLLIDVCQFTYVVRDIRTTTFDKVFDAEVTMDPVSPFNKFKK